MPHRKPLGTTCRIWFASDTWEPMPDISSYLVSEAGTAYLIVGIEEHGSRTSYLCERVAEPAPMAQIFEFYWLPRERAKK